MRRDETKPGVRTNFGITHFAGIAMPGADNHACMVLADDALRNRRRPRNFPHMDADHGYCRQA